MWRIAFMAAGALVVVWAASAEARADGAPAIEADVPLRGIFSLRPAPRWEEALLIGNGRMGGLVMSRPFDETITLTHERLFLPIAEQRPTVETGSRLDEIRKLIRDGQYAQAAGLVMQIDKDQGRPGRLVWADPFFPACDLRITLDNEAKPTGYRRSLDYATGVARVQWTDADTRYQQRAFISRPDNAMVLELTAEGAKGLTGRIAVGPHVPGPKENDKERRSAGNGPASPTVSAEGQWMTLRGAYRKAPAGYEIVARVMADGGKTQAKDGAIGVEGASKVTVLLRIVPLNDFKNSSVARTRKGLESVGGDFDALLKRHVAVHGAIYGRQRLDLGAAADRQIPAEQLYQETHDKAATPALLEQVFDAGRYEILCCCGDWPPNLQGVWAGVWNTPWRSAYTLNGNMPSAIANLLNGNMPELMHSVFGYFEPMMEHFRSNAKRHYNARGIFIPAHASRFGYDLSYNQTYCHTFWTAGAAWYAGFYYDYYLYTGDKDFLRDKALPFMKDAALFYEDFLTKEVKDAQGVYEFNPSYSPENTPAGGNSQATINATMDLAACRQLLGNLVKACTELGIEKDNVAKWKAMMASLPKYMIGENGELKEWCKAQLRENHSHRHCSHFLGLWYGIDPAIADDPALLAAAKKAVLLRTESRAKRGGVMGFGAVQIGLAAASLGDAESAWFSVDRLATRYYYPTFASSHNAGPSIFNADISGGLPAVIVEMLVQSQPGSITLLPALPKQMPAGRIVGVPCRGQVTVEELKWSPDKVEFTLRSAKDQEMTVDCRRGDRGHKIKLRLKANEPVTRQFPVK